MKPHHKRLWIALGLGLCLRLTFINLPILEVKSFEQCQFASLARDIFTHHFLLTGQEYEYGGDSLYAYLIAYVYVLLGGVYEWGGRLLGILFSCGVWRYIYLWTKKLVDKKSAIWAVWAYALSPLDIIYSRTFLPDTAIAFACIATMYHLYQWQQEENFSDWMFAIFYTTLAMLLRFSSLFLWVPAIYVFGQGYGKWALKNHKLWGYLLLTTGGTVLWHLLTNADVFAEDIWNDIIGKYFEVSVWFTLEFWKSMIKALGGKVLTPLGLLIFLKAIWGNRTPQLKFLYVCIGSAALYLLAIAQISMEENFYFMPFLAVAAVWVGIELGKGNLGLAVSLPKAVKTTLSVIFFISVAAQLSSAYSLADHYKYTQAAGEELQNYATQKDLVMATRRLYYCNRKGWAFPLDKELKDEYLIEKYKTFRSKGARYFVMTEVENYEQHKKFLSYVLDDCDEIVVEKGYRIYRLRHPVS